MAELHVEGDQLRLELTPMEKVEGMHRDLAAPLAAIRAVEVLDDAHEAAGVRAGMKMGTRLPGLVEVGRVRDLHTKRFVAVHADTPRGIRIIFTGGEFDEWIVGCADPEDTAGAIPLPR